MRLLTLAVLTSLVTLANGCALVPAASPDPGLLGMWRSTSGPEHFIDVGPSRLRTFEMAPGDRCSKLEFEYPLLGGAASEAGAVYGTEEDTWALAWDGGAVLVAERRASGPGGASTRTYERMLSRAEVWSRTACN